RPASPANLTMKLEIAGLEGNQVAAFMNLFSAGGRPQDFWKTLEQNPAFQTQKVSLLQSVFTLSKLTGEQMARTAELITAQNIRPPAAPPALAATTSVDWLNILERQKIAPPAGIPGNTPADQ